MKALIVATIVAGAAIATANWTFADDAALQTITIADVGAGSANHWPAYGAIANGYFAQSGLDVQFISTQSSAAAMQQLAAGATDIGSSGLVDALRAIDKGAPITLLRIETGPAPYQVYAKSTIHSFAELKGKVVMLGGPKDITRIYFERMSVSQGLAVGSYDTLFAGATSARFAALASGAVDAAILNAPFTFKAKAEHYSYLPGAPDFSKGIPFTGYSANVAWAKAHQPLIGKFLAAYAKGVSWFYDPANREQAVDVLLKHSKVTRDEAEQAYDLNISIKEFDRAGTVDKESIGALLEILHAQGDLTDTNLSTFYKPEIVGTSP